MGLQTRYVAYAVNLETEAGTSAWINECENYALDNGVSLFEETTGSQTDREFVAAKLIQPKVKISTFDLTVLSTVNFSGCFINSGDAAPGAVLWGRLLPLGSTPDALANASAISFEVSDGLLVPDSVQAGNNSLAKLGMTLHAILGTDETSGATPIVVATDQTIPTGASQAANFYVSGPVKFTDGTGTLLQNGITNLAVNFGIKLLVEATDGDSHVTELGIIERMPTIEFTTKDPTLADRVAEGEATTAFAAYFRNVAALGQRTAPGTASHVKIFGTTGMIKPGSARFQHGQSGEAAFTWHPVLDSGTTLSIDTASVVPTS